MHNILITGGCGFIGTNLIAHLQGRGGFNIRVLDNESLGKRENIAGFDCEFIHGDLLDEAAVKTALAGMEIVVHLAADTRVMDSIEDPRHNFESNVRGTFGLLLAMRNAGITTFVNASTGGAILGEVPPPVHETMLPQPISPYGASKLAVEGYCSAFAGSYGFHATSLRFSNVYGPRSFHKGSVVAHFFKRILAGEELVIYGDGSQRRDYVYIEDLCDGIQKAMLSGKSGVFQLGSGRPTTLNELVEIMSDVVGPSWRVETRYEDFRPGEIHSTWGDITKARNELGFDPATDLRQGMAATWHWFLTTSKFSRSPS